MDEAVSKSRPDDSNVQIKADLKEIRRRIAAFQNRKRKEVDDLNLQEFCNRPRAEVAPEYSCCRVDAVVVPRAGSKGHIKVSRVANEWGPQTVAVSRGRYVPPPMPNSMPLASSKENSGGSTAGSATDEIPEGVQERLSNMESHLRLKPGKPVPSDVYARLQNLEDRILFLEGVSPDYFVDQPRGFSKTEIGGRKMAAAASEMSLGEIDDQIRSLRESLLKHKK